MKTKLSPQIRQLSQIHEFVRQTEGLKKLLRHSWLSDGRQESVAEHSWRMALMAMTLHRELDFEVNIAKVLKMIIVHDLAEILAGDYELLKKCPRISMSKN